MKLWHTRIGLIVALLLGGSLISNAQSANYLFAYFTNNGEDGLHLMHSRDGLKWSALNGGKSYLTPTVGSQKLMRDPCILQGPDGVFHMVWTTGWEGRDIGIAHSKDLINWSEQKAIPVLEHEPTAMNCWAPEIFYDKANQQYLIFWSTTIPGKFPETAGSAGKGRNHRIYFVTTKDFVNYSKAELFYDGGFNVIDATIVQDGKQFVMVIKDETELPTAKKHLRLATSNKAVGPYSKASDKFTMDWVEGATVIKINGEWVVYYDMYRDHRYGAVKTRDWKTWETITDKIDFPQGVRHGTVFAVSDAVMNKLRVNWRNALQQRAEWYNGAEARQIADNVLLYQRDNGGWDKNIDMATPLAPAERAKILADKDAPHSTIDNGATVTQLHYLARVFNATQQPQYGDAFLKGLDYLLAAQYANGGWPQYYPLRKGYYTHITYNDNAMIGVMQLFRLIAKKDAAFAFVDETRRTKAEQAIAKGLDIILKTQVVVNGKQTVWCAQHDKTTLAPAPARAYEKISLSGSESVCIVRYLMSLENPTPEISAAINGAVAWFGQAKLTGIKVIEKPDASFARGVDRVVVPTEKDEKAAPLWARFYDINTNRPIFCGRDGIIKPTLAEIEHERRVGYSWYTNAPAVLLTQEFPAWQTQQAHKR